jgi:hypothetical protein
MSLGLTPMLMHMWSILSETKAQIHPGYSPILSIVFVHGILGDHKSAWTHEETETLWPRDLLQIDFPQSRILTFNYSPNFDDFFLPGNTKIPYGATDYDDDYDELQVCKYSGELLSALGRFWAETKTVAIDKSTQKVEL